MQTINITIPYRTETLDIEDVEYKEADIEQDILFNSEGERNN